MEIIVMCDEVSSDECEAKTYARKRYTESQSSIYARSSGKLKAIVDTPRDVNQIPTTGHSARKKCSERLLLKDAYWNSNRPKVMKPSPPTEWTALAG